MAKKPTKQDYARRWETRRRNAALKAKQEANSIVRTRTLDAPATQGNAGSVLGAGAPQTYDPVGALVDYETNNIMGAARKKDSHSQIKQRLHLFRGEAVRSTQKAMQEEHSDRIREINKIHAIDTVSSFMAIVEAAGRLNGGPLPPAMVIGGRVVAKVYDALREAGYTPNGFQTQRENIMNKDSALRR